jgi:hypothetical protein
MKRISIVNEWVGAPMEPRLRADSLVYACQSRNTYLVNSLEDGGK